MKTGELQFEVSGSGGIPLICVPGWACNAGQFIELAGLLAGKFRVFRLDLPGHGRTPLDGFTPGFDAFAGKITDFVLKHKLERPVLLGHSMGGVLSLMAAASGWLQPRAVINLDGSLPSAKKSLAGLRMIRGWLNDPEFRPRLAKLLRETFFLSFERDTRCEAIIQTMCSAPEAVLRFLPEQADGLHPGKILPRVKAPVLFVGSAVPRFDSETAATMITNFRLERIPNAGHFLHVYAADKVAALIENFLASEISG